MNFNKEFLIFLHIRKTGGTTLEKYIRMHIQKTNVFKITGACHNVKDLLNLSQSERDQKELLVGTFRYGLHKHFNKNPSYVTMMRHPVERVVSEYYYMRTKKISLLKLITGNYGIKYKNKLDDVKRLSLIDYIRKEKSLHRQQIRSLSGYPNPAENRNNRSELEIAKCHLESDFKLCGITEEYESSMYILNKILHWEQAPYKIRNKTKKRPKISEISQAILDEISELCQDEIELYEYAKKIFNKKKQEYLNPKIEEKLLCK